MTAEHPNPSPDQLTQSDLDEISKEIFEITQNVRMPKVASDKLRELALRLQPGHISFGLVKFADGTFGCKSCGVRAAGDGSVAHNRDFSHD